MPNNLLSDIPAAVIESAYMMADSEDEELIGFRAITALDGPGRVKPVRWMIVTNNGVYEYDPDGICQRASVLHDMPARPTKTEPVCDGLPLDQTTCPDKAGHM